MSASGPSCLLVLSVFTLYVAVVWGVFNCICLFFGFKPNQYKDNKAKKIYLFICLIKHGIIPEFSIWRLTFHIESQPQKAEFCR